MINDNIRQEFEQNFKEPLVFTKKRIKKHFNSRVSSLNKSGVIEFKKKYSKDFEVLSFIGTGSFGDVFKVRWKEDNNLYAVKWSKKKHRGNFDRKASILELYTFSLVGSHPHLVDFVQAWASCGHMLVQSELCELGNLEDRLDYKSPLEESEIWKILLHITLATKWLHDQQFLHLDIKPDNIFLSGQGCYKLGDFGLSQYITTNGNVPEGDSRYLAEEVLKYQENGTASDIFSIGASVFEASESVDMPSQGKLWHKLREDPPLLNNRSSQLNNLIHKCVFVMN
jgi:serine/threonine protein kinase